MTNTTRRKFLRDAGLTATGVCLVSNQLSATKKDIRTNTVKCAPQSYALFGTISSTKSGKWSDPATWGGRVPGAGDTPVISSGHTVVYDLKDSTVAGVNVNSSGILQFDAANSVTLTSTKNVEIQGKLQMVPASAAVIHKLVFTGINEAAYIGGGMNVVAGDTGLWVMGSGQLELIGATKTSWTRAAGSIAAGATSISLEASPMGWAAGDEISIAPTESPTVGAAFTSGFDERTIQSISGSSLTLNAGTVRSHPKVNNKWTAEVMNLTRNVRIEGTASGRAHIYIRSTMPQTVKFVAIRYMGPRKDTNGNSITELVAGRYGLHFHHCYDGSRSSMIEGNVIRDTTNHSYVPHQSHGITMKDNVAYNVVETAFWWDPSEASHDILWDHNIVGICRYIPGSLNMNAEFAPTFSSSGFALNTGDSNVCINNVVVGGSLGDVAEGGGYNWEATLNEGIWTFFGNMSHNNAGGLRIWQNTVRNHVIEDFTAYHNGLAIFHGAYANSYTYTGLTLYGNGIQIKAASGNSNRVRFENVVLDGAGIIDYGIEIIHSPLPGERPILIRNATISNCKVAAILDNNEPEIHSVDIIQSNISGAIILDQVASAGETIRVQPLSGTPYQITKAGRSDIAKFAPTIWGTGKGLKAEYYNSANFTNHALTRIDSNVSFSEWSTGVHYKITGQTYSVRWTGKIQPQYSEQYTFSLHSGGGHRLWIDNKLILDGWTDHYPDTFTATPISLVAGQLYDIKLEFFNTTGGTGIGLSWQSPSLPREYVPQTQLYADPLAQPNQPPVANAGADITITLPISNTTLNGTSSLDPDGTIASYKWTQVSGPSKATIASDTSATSGVSNLIAGTYVFRLTVTDNKGVTSTDDVTVSVNAPNQAPVANAGTDISITLPTNSATLNGSASKDPDGTIVKYGWIKISGPSQYTIADANAVSTSLTNLVAGTYIFRLQVTDNKGATANDDVTVVVNNTSTPANRPPVAVAGSDMTITLPTSSVTLNGSASYDPDGSSIAKYSWTKISGPAQFLLASAGSPITVVSNLTAGTYVFRLTVTDNKGATASDDITVVVNQANSTNNQPPIANAGADITVQLPLSTKITLDGSASRDPDGTITEYRWTKISGPSQFNLSTWSTPTTRLDEVVEGVYVFRLTVTDDKGATSTDTVTVTVIAAKSPHLGLLTVTASPNPSTSVFRLKITSANTDGVNLRIYDDAGRLVTRMVVRHDTTVTVGAFWRPGVYTAVVTQDTQQAMVKLLKQ